MAVGKWQSGWPWLLMLLFIQAGAAADPNTSKTGDVALPTSESGAPDASASWRVYRTSEQFEMRYRDTKTAGRPVLQIQVQFVFKGRMSAFFQVLRDTEHADQWLDSVHSVRVIASPGPFEDWVHTTFDTPWPLQKREMVTCSNWIQNIDYSIEMSVFSCNGNWPLSPDTVRIEQLNAEWTLRSLADYQVQVLYTGTADAAGGIPRWLSDPIALTSSLRSFRALQLQLALPGYQQPLAEVCEPEFTAQGELLPADLPAPACQKLQARLRH